MIRRTITTIATLCVLTGPVLADETTEKSEDRENLRDVIHDMIPNCPSSVASSTDPADMPACGISTSIQTRSVYYALAERFRRDSWSAALYRASGGWGTEFATYVFEKAGMTIRQDYNASGITQLNQAGELGYCIDVMNVSSSVFVRFLHETFSPRPGDVVFFYDTTTPGRTFAGCDCSVSYHPFKGSHPRSHCALYCATQVGVFLGKTGSDIVVAIGNVAGKVRVHKVTNYSDSATHTVGFGRINRSTIDCRGL